MSKSLVLPDYPRGFGKTSIVKTNGTTQDTSKTKKNFQKSIRKQGKFQNGNSDNSNESKPISSTHWDTDDLFKIPKSSTQKVQKSKKKGLKLTAEETNLLIGDEKGRGAKDKAFTVVPIGYTSITEGILSLGRIETVRDSEMLVSLPGRMIGSVPITSVSTPYTKVLEKLASGENVEDAVYSVNELFTPGQLVIVAVKNVDSSSTTSGKSTTRVTLSLNPKDIHENWKAEDLFENLVLTGAVESLEDHGYVIDLGIPGSNAFLPLHATKGFIKGPNGGKPLGIGQLVPVRLKSVKFTKGKSFVELTATPQEITSVQYTLADLNSRLFLPGMTSEATVMEASPTGLKVDFLDSVGEIHIDHLPGPWNLPESYEIGTSLHPRILYIRPFISTPTLTLQSGLCSTKWSKLHSLHSSTEGIRLGDKYKVKIKRWESRGLIIEFKETGARGIVSITRCSDDASLTREELMKKFPVGSTHETRVLEYSSIDNIYIASFQKTILSMDFVRVDQLSIGQVVKCTLIKWNNGGAIVGLGKVKGFIPLIHFGDGKLSNPSTMYPIGSQFKARVIQIDVTKNNVKLTAKKKLVKSDGALLVGWNEIIEPGIISDGVVSRVSSQGINVFTLGGLPGFIPKSKAIRGSQPINPESIFYPGQVLRFQVVESNPEKKQLILTLFVNDDEKEKEAENSSETVTNGLSKAQKVAPEDQSKRNRKAKKRKSTEIEPKLEPKEDPEILEISEDEGIAEESSPSKSKKVKKNKKKNPKTQLELELKSNHQPRKRKISELSEHSDSSLTPLVLLPRKRKSPEELPSLEDSGSIHPTSFFNLTNYVRNGPGATENADDDELSSEDEETESHNDNEKKGKQKSQISKSKIREQEIREIESKLADPESSPQSIQDFERLVLASPNSSMAWTAYISFLLQLADIENARKVGKRALSTILFRETHEIENVWKVLLRMEGMFGTEDELQNLFKEAIRANDELPMFYTLCEIYDHHGKAEELKKIFNVMSKKFKHNVKVWTWIIRYYYKKGLLDDGREWFKSGLAMLGQNNSGGSGGQLGKTIELISSTAVLEFTYGDVERGKTILDSTLETHPKRLDLWILYAKQLIKKGLIESARDVFLRSTSTPFPPKRMSQLLKDFLEFETKHGNSTTKEQVKEIALKYVKNIDAHL